MLDMQIGYISCLELFLKTIKEGYKQTISKELFDSLGIPKRSKNLDTMLVNPMPLLGVWMLVWSRLTT